MSTDLACSEARWFQYEPLSLHEKSFRLLQVLPQKPPGPIRCVLRNFTRRERPEYYALSYTWNTISTFDKMVECNGSQLSIGRNLWEFLFQYQQPVSQEEWIWIDAICIDQNNILERNHQVAQMRDIYSGAALVLVWLGTNVETIRACQTLRQFQDIFRTMHYDAFAQDNGKFPVILDALDKLTRGSTYWTRAWVVQEFVLAQDLLAWCANASLDVEYLTSLLLWVKQQTPELAAAARLCTHRAAWHHEEEDIKTGWFTFDSLMYQHPPLQSSLLVDRVYSMLGIALDLDDRPRKLEVDYSKTPGELWNEVARQICQWEKAEDKQGNVNLLLKLGEIFDMGEGVVRDKISLVAGIDSKQVDQYVQSRRQDEEVHP